MTYSSEVRLWDCNRPSGVENKCLTSANMTQSDIQLLDRCSFIHSRPYYWEHVIKPKFPA